ncbi:UDP-N-acetylmuramoyl-tripeptide--D-alanyl-D-alanine ligase [Litorimonas cladophorae]|uniref:UDP-N-acetylmuramoyl-tripeptide--D-alanyl-D-alanine ligase n=1 Tax=Litorimonas cladophorae TaxID=1220491 RepID=A0A918NBT7_9PROT|nr:UDP-N-acetylmuramoyl-tripeptide--D-alanyl-D-alanine ligase [Litorimonas cladophorae]GGX60959.1 UDP-N-acetylmuramoyl-tripeptide--D-alanyl-D-alanine ligase [Litorimonas cladophorae]
MTLWTSAEIAQATGGVAVQDFTVTGLSIDTRTLQPGDLFVALKDVRDGHDFIPAAVLAGAGGVLCERSDKGVNAVIVDDVSNALEVLGVHARDTRKALRIGVTGSVGKTSVKEALAVMLGTFGLSHKSLKSFNNHIGVPITLATLPEGADYAVFEMGMNHAGEMSQLSKWVQPQIALINNVVGAHLANFENVEGIADAKAEIIDGMVPGSLLILNGDNPYTPRIRAKAEAANLRVLTFGHSDADDVAIVSANSHALGGNVRLRIAKQQIDVTLMVPGEHWFMNAAACMAVAYAADLPLRKAAMALRKIVPAPGRGDTRTLIIDGKQITLIDESYNANPTSMRAAFAASALRPGRKLALLGDMFELGADELERHRELAEPLITAGFERVFVAGECMRFLMGAMPQPMRGGWSTKPQTLLTKLKGELLDGDILLIKGSNASGVGAVAAQLKGESV